MANRTLVSIEVEVCEIDAAIRRKSNTPRRVLHRVCVCTCWTPNRVAAHCSLAAARAGFRAFCVGLGAVGTNQLRRERALLLLSAHSGSERLDGSRLAFEICRSRDDVDGAQGRLPRFRENALLRVVGHDAVHADDVVGCAAGDKRVAGVTVSGTCIGLTAARGHAVAVRPDRLVTSRPASATSIQAAT